MVLIVFYYGDIQRPLLVTSNSKIPWSFICLLLNYSTLSIILIIGEILWCGDLPMIGVFKNRIWIFTQTILLRKIVVSKLKFNF